MAKGLHRVQSIHSAVLRGNPLLLSPEGLLVRWPDRVPMPEIGAWVEGTAVTVPPQLRETVMTLLFGASPLARCDAAQRLAQNKEHRKRILSRMFSRSFVQQALASAERIEPWMRAEIEAIDGMPIRKVFQLASNPRWKRRRETSACTPKKGS
jgi:hypothetical protein